MNNFVIQRNARGARETAVAKKCALHSPRPHPLGRKRVQVAGGHAGLDRRRHFRQNFRGNLTGDTHPINFGACFDGNHLASRRN